MNLKSMDNAELKKETARALKALNKVEEQFVEAQNLVSMLEDEDDRRNLVRESSIPPQKVSEILNRWTIKSDDMQSAAEAMSFNPVAKNSLLQQRDVLLECVADLKRIWRD